MAVPWLPCSFGARLKEVIARSTGFHDPLRPTDMHRRTKLTRTSLAVAIAIVVSAAPLAAQQSAAKVTYQVGQVSIFNGGYLKALSLGDQVKAQQMIVTGPDGYARFEVLSDHSTFEVFQNSKVIFRETPGDWQHLLNLFIGRVKVFIQHAPGVPNPNNVTSPTAVISVRGTVFDVVVQDDDTTFVTVDEGEVAVRNLTAPGNAAILHPGDSITVYRGQPLFARQIDKGAILRRILYAARDAIYQMPRPTGGSAPIPGAGGTGGAQGDRGPAKGGGSTSGGNAPGAPPTAPGAPPAGPGGN